MRRINLLEFGTVQTRARLGQQVRLWLERNLNELAENETLEVDCQGVSVMDRRFATAAFGPLFTDLATGFYGQRSLGFLNSNADVSAAIQAAIIWAGLDKQGKTQLKIGAPAL